MPAVGGLGGGEPVVVPDRVRRRGVVGRVVLGALAGGDDLEAAGPGPVDQLADQRRLVAVGEGVDDAGLPGGRGQHGDRPGRRPPRSPPPGACRRRSRRGRARRRPPGCRSPRPPRRRRPARAVVGRRRVKAVASIRAARPADLPAGPAGPLDVEVGDGGDLERRVGHLGQEHRAELAGADEPHPDRPAGCRPFLRQAEEVHEPTPAVEARSPRQSSASGSMGVKSRCAIHGARAKRRMWLSTRHSER